MKHNTFFLALVAVTALTSCKIEKKSDVAAKQSTVQKNKVLQKTISSQELTLEQVEYEFVGQQQPDVYNLNFSWPATQNKVRVSVDGQVKFTVNTAERSGESVLSLQGGRNVSVLIEILDEKYHVAASMVQMLEVPKDFIFPQQYQLTSDVTITNERVFMSNTAILTENFNLKIHTKKLIILNSSTIQNYLTTAKARNGLDGRSGGLVEIKAEEAIGDITFNMNSEAGGDALMGYAEGTSGWVPKFICINGSNGFNAGQNGDLILNIKNINQFRYYRNEYYSSGGKLAPALNKDTGGKYPSMLGTTVDCPATPVVGADAQPGRVCLTFSDQVPQAGCY